MDIYEQLQRDEGKRKFPYLDTVGKTTIGYGHNLTDKGLTDAQIMQILEDDVAEVTGALALALPWFDGLTEPRQGVIVNMAFNMGLRGLLAFEKTLGFVEAGDYEQAATEMLNSRWATQVGGRATRLAQQLQTGQWV